MNSLRLYLMQNETQILSGCRKQLHDCPLAIGSIVICIRFFLSNRLQQHLMKEVNDMKAPSWVLKGDIGFSHSSQELQTLENGYLVCLNGISMGVFPAIPEIYQHLPLYDFSGYLILPGLTDLHLHAPQYTFRGLGMDLELLDWLNTYTFPEEARYASLEYARNAYTRFVADLRNSPNTRACIFATIHREATCFLMDLLEASGLVTFVGKVNMDRNSPDNLRESSVETAKQETVHWLEDTIGHYQNVSPILTPRFVPSCSDELLQEIGQLQRTYHLPVQSHLSENQSEVDWVKKLSPTSSCYGDAYDRFGLFGGADCPTIMAHCVLSDEQEMELLRKRQVYVAHCPASNTNLASGIAPVRKFLQREIPIGLGSDIAGGTHCSIFRAMADAIQVSKLRWRLLSPEDPPLTVSEAFWMGTVGGGSFFGSVGSFLPGYHCDVLVLNDKRYNSPRAYTLQQRIERTIYLFEQSDLLHKYVSGVQLF